MKSKIFLPLIAISSLLIAGIFYFNSRTDNSPSLSVQELVNKSQQLQEQRPEERIYAQLDKPIYAPGETIWFTAYVRNGSDLKASTQSEIIHVDLINPAQAVARSFQIFVANGIAKGDLTIPKDAPGGQYELKLYSDYQKNDPNPAIFSKKLMIQQLVLPKLKMDLDFVKKGYSPGSKVQAQLKLEDNTNQSLANQAFDFRLSVDGIKGSIYHAKTNKEGVADIQFNLPKTVSTTDVLLTITTVHRKERSSIARQVPIVLKQLAIDFFPEGGDLIANLPNNVAFKAIDNFGRAVDIKGQVHNQKGEVIATIESKHKGMGSFSFRPMKGDSYTFVPTYPTGIEDKFELPKVYNDGYVLSVQEVNKDAINLNIYSTKKNKVSLVAGVRGKKHFSTRLNLSKGLTPLEIPIRDFPIGIAQITLFDQEGIARAERLTFVNLHKQLNIDIETNKKEYQPREKVEVSLEVTDAQGKPVSTSLSFAAVDDQLLSYSADQSSNILSWMLVEADIDIALEDPAYYLNPDKAEASAALDHVLMTAGWRRFSWEAIQKDAIPALEYAAQKKEIAGTVLNADGNPLSGAKVVLKDLTTPIKTDANGQFKIDQDIDLLDQSVEIAIAAPGHRRASYQLAKYGNVDYQLEDRNGWRNNREEDLAIANNNRPRSSNNTSNALISTRFQVKSTLNDWAVKNPGISVEDMRGSENAGADQHLKVTDHRASNYEWNTTTTAQDTIIQTRVLPEVVYYRARKFPAPVYSKTKANHKRTDFRSTVFWDGAIETDENGKATVSFYNSDAISSFRISTEGISPEGHIGRKTEKYFTQMPFSISAKIPLEVVSGDVIEVPVYIDNNTDYPVAGLLNIDIPDSFESLNNFNNKVRLNAQEKKVVVLKYKIKDTANTGASGEFKLSFNSKVFKDEIAEQVSVVPKGFPVSIAHSGTDKETTYEIKITKPIDGSLEAYVEAYPTTLSEILQGMEAMLREPNGCFEQTSSSNYPNIIALQYLKATDQDNLVINRKAQQYFEQGYKRLKTFETPQGGFNWFGKGKGNEVITAFGLMQFVHMNEVYDGVEASLLQRTTSWLLSRRDGKGGFKINDDALKSLGYNNGKDHIYNAYILYALSEAKVLNLNEELRHAHELAIKENNNYLKGLVANTLYNYGFAKQGAEVLASMQQQEVQDNKATAFGGSAISSDLQTKALTLMAMLKEEKPDIPSAKLIANEIRAQRRNAGSFGSTRNTVMALRALTAYSKYAQTTMEDGTIEVYVDQQKVASHDYKKGVHEPIKISGLNAFLENPQHEVTVKYKDAEYPMPHTLVVQWNMETPPNSTQAPLVLDTRLEEEQVKTGDMVRLSARLTNITEEVQATPIAIIGLPAGLSPQAWQLNDLVKNTAIDYYEIKGNNLVFYYEYLDPKAEESINLDLKAEFAGNFDAPASTAYPYYAAEHRTWSSLAAIQVQ